MRQLTAEPIFVIRIKPPLNPHKHIYNIDRELLRITATMRGRIYRIDDFTALDAHHFTLSDAYDWLTGPVREDAIWRSPIVHVAVASAPLEHLVQRIHHSGEKVYVPLFQSVPEAVDYTRLEIIRHSGRG